jgi:signal peptidase I
MAGTSKSTGTPRWRGGWLRLLAESGAMLTISVAIFRTFVAQGYMIETGSMAPGLWGYHRRAECPSCHISFSVGESRAEGSVACPNCGQGGIDADSLLRNDGDQLLVVRAAYDLQKPHRWGVVVFRNPSNTRQAYVKRIVGLPGELLQILRGNIYVCDRIQAKPLEIQRAMHVPVYDHAHPPDDHDPDWRPRWVIDAEGHGWEAHGSQFGFEGLQPPPATADNLTQPIDLLALAKVENQDSSTTTAAKPVSPAGLSYVHYRHWIRSGGRHRTSVRIAEWPASVPQPEQAVDVLEYNAKRGTLVCKGALPAERRDALKQGAPPDFQKAIDELYEGSHVAPILDIYGYNGTDFESGRREVRDLALCLTLTQVEGEGTFALGLSDGTGAYECRFDFGKDELRIVDRLTDREVRTLPLPGSWPGTHELELSLMDQQLGLALDKGEVFTWSYPNPKESGHTAWRPAWFGASALKARVGEIRLFRDVHYTSGEAGRAQAEPVQLGPDEYFVLGDNSPISRDSRSWEPGQVLTSQLLLGKPFLVHLPSVRQRLMRYIR